MSGAAGHLVSLIENRSSSISTIKRILYDVVCGTLQDVSEKLDGINLVFTYNADHGKVYAARCIGDIESDGLDEDGLIKRFTRHPHVCDVVISAMKTLDEFVGRMSTEERTVVFGSAIARWYSLEVLHVATPNTIHYDGNHIVFHEWPRFDRAFHGRIDRNVVPSRVGIDVIESVANRSKRIGEFEVHGPVRVQLRHSASRVITDALHQIDMDMDRLGLTDNATLNDVMYVEAVSLVKNHYTMSGDVDMLARKLVDAPGAKHANVIKKTFGAVSPATALMQTRKSWQASWLYPIERAIYHVVVEVLRNTRSRFVSDVDGEVTRLRRVVKDIVDNPRDDEHRRFITAQMTLLEDVGNVSPIEGIVFRDRAMTYKFTGAFAPMHQIIASVKYHNEDDDNGRKGV